MSRHSASRRRVMTDAAAEPSAAVRRHGWWWALGGPHAITLWSWSLTSAAALLVAALYDAAVFDLSVWSRMVLVIVTQVVLLPFVLAAHFVLTRLPRPMPILGLLLMVGLGAVRALVIMLLAPAIEPLAIDSLAYQFGINITFSLLTLPVIAVIVDALRQHRALHARVLAEQKMWDAALLAAEEQFNAEYAEYREIVRRDISAAVVALLDDLDRLTRQSRDVTAAVDQLRRLSAEVVRPLSHELILEPSRIEVRPAQPLPVPGRLTLRDVLDETRKAPFAGRWGLTAVLSLLGIVGLSIEGSVVLVILNLGWDIVIFGVVPAVLARLLGTRLARWGPFPAWAFAGSAWVGIGIVAVLGTAVLTGVVTGQSTAFWAVAIAYSVLAAILAAAFAAFRCQRQLDDDLLRMLHLGESQTAALLRRIDHARRRLGLVLHGAVQANLTRAALGLERWDPHGDPDAMGAVVREVRTALETALESFEPADVEPRQTLRAAVLPRLQIWEGVITTTLTISGAAEEVDTPALAADAGDVIGEALVNAVRHGQAEHVDVTIAGDDDMLVITVIDDGSGFAGDAEAGAGLGGLIRPGYSWTLDREVDRTVLTVRMPLARADSADRNVVETEQPAARAPAPS